jgi:hypothetical protein
MPIKIQPTHLLMRINYENHSPEALWPERKVQVGIGGGMIDIIEAQGKTVKVITL